MKVSSKVLKDGCAVEACSRARLTSGAVLQAAVVELSLLELLEVLLGGQK